MSQVYNNSNQALINAFNSGQHIIVKNDQITTENSIMHGLRKIFSVFHIMDSIKDMNIKLRAKMSEILQNHGTSKDLVDSMRNNRVNDGELDQFETALMKHTLGIKDKNGDTQLEIELQTFSSNDTSQLSDDAIVKAKNKEIMAGKLRELRLHTINSPENAKAFYGRICAKCSNSLKGKVDNLIGGKANLKNIDFTAKQVQVMNMVKIGVPKPALIHPLQTSCRNLNSAKTPEDKSARSKAFAELLQTQMGVIKSKQDRLMPYFDEASHAEIRKATVEAMLDSHYFIKRAALRNKDEILAHIDTKSAYGAALKDVLDSIYNEMKQEVISLDSKKIAHSDNPEETLKACIHDFLDGNSKYVPDKEV